MRKISILMVLAGIIIWSACKKDDTGNKMTAKFSYHIVDTTPNYVVFTNESEGTYSTFTWDFGNGEQLQDSNEVTVFYPGAGDYAVSLTVTENGESNQYSQTISILNSLFLSRMSYQIQDTNANYVLFTNKSTGDFDTYEWISGTFTYQDQDSLMLYFPYKGTHQVMLNIYAGDSVSSSTQSIEITNDDPDFLPRMNLVWSDEFEGTEVDTRNWTFETGASGWGNQEWQNYTKNNAKIQDGILVITAEKVNDRHTVGSYTSTRLKSQSKQTFTYGRMEIRARLPEGTGIWPALWMLGQNIGSAGWPGCGEIDILEYVGYRPNVVQSTLHTLSSYGASVNSKTKILTTCEEEFHNYGMIWTKDYMKFYIDDPDNVFYTYNPSVKDNNTWPFDKPQFFILNVAVGGTWGGSQGVDDSIFPQELEIDYVRVYNLD